MYMYKKQYCFQIRNRCTTVSSFMNQNIVCDVINIVFSNGTVNVDYVINIDFPAALQMMVNTVVISIFYRKELVTDFIFTFRRQS